ncbi:PREDICTED: pentatricopeptide repeat-containing protein At4g18975, chloroplastic isoform X2 [Tarenaya hassleriana]|nr:PREDICTED: pentatricopeptide repeat-containing protein At4g18975, chloroplastic isoform X2 [Tarenaya hassleriana]
MVDCGECLEKQARHLVGSPRAAVKRREIKKVQRTEHHLWKKRDSARSGQKAANLVRMLSGLPNEKEAVYGALNKWVAWEIEFPVIAAAKALRILRKRNHWRRVIQVAKWMLSKGQGATMATYDTLLLAFDMDQRVDEAESLWSMILHTHTRSIPKRLFSRIIALYAHHDLQDKVIEVFADMEELGVRPDQDTTKRVARAFRELGQEEKRKLVLRRYLSEFKYAHFNGERVRVKRYFSEED